MTISGYNNRIFGAIGDSNKKHFDVGWSWSNGDGAGSWFGSSDYGSEAGFFGLFARNSTSVSKELIGRPNGSLTWAGNEVITAGNISSHIGSNVLLLSGGTMTGGNINWTSDSHGVYFYNNCGIEKWSGYGPSLVAENGLTFEISSRSDRASRTTIITASNIGSYTAGAASSVSWSNVSSKPNVAIQASDNNMIAHSNECNLVPSGYSDTFYFNYRTTGSNGSLSYRMCAASSSLANVTANQYYAESDRRLKKNIKSFDNKELTDLFNVSDKLFKSFTWKRTNKLSCGLISQQLEKYIPESIEELNPKDKKQKYYSVNYQVAYAKIIASLVNEIKQMKEYYESRFKLIEEMIQKMQA